MKEDGDLQMSLLLLDQQETSGSARGQSCVTALLYRAYSAINYNVVLEKAYFGSSDISHSMAVCF